VIKKLATDEVKPIEDDDEYAQEQIIHDPFMHHGSINAHDDGSTSRSGHDSSVPVIQNSPQVEDNNQVDDQNRSEDNSTQDHSFDPSINQDKDDEDEGLIQRRTQVPHPRVHHTIQRDHPVDNNLGSIQRGVITRSRLASFCEHFSFVSPKEPKKVEEAIDDEDWMIAMQEELNNFTRNEVWTLVERPKQNVIGTKWVFRNKQDEHGVVTRNKARLVAQGFTQIEGLDFGETYAPVARLESI
jgi:hypothetical protein